MANDKFWYVATPYTKFPAGLNAAFEMACKATANLMEAGLVVYSPIAHGHPVCEYMGNIAKFTDHAFWMRQDQPFIVAAHGLIVITAETWALSRGIAAEINRFDALKKPVVYLSMAETESPKYLARAGIIE